MLATYIRELFLAPGARLSEAETAAQLKLSRTPVHDTFAQLSREKMLEVEPQRGTFVCRLDPENIRQLVWMNRTAIKAVLENLYIHRLTVKQLEPLETCVAAESAALQRGEVVSLARLNTEFYRTLFDLAGYLPVYRALRRAGADLYRLRRLAEQPDYWHGLICQHALMVQALALHEHEQASAAVDREFDSIGPLLAAVQRACPQYFTEPETTPERGTLA